MARLSPLVASIALTLSLSGCLTTAAQDAQNKVATPADDAAQATARTGAVAADNPAATALAAAIAGSWRDPKNAARDVYRHPAETLTFFQVEPGETVLEIAPGAGWYSEILSPYLRDTGKYLAAITDPAAAPDAKVRAGRQKAKDALQAKFSAAPAQYDRAELVGYDPTKPIFGGANTVDTVLTFRNVHNWRMSKQAEGMFKGFYEVLKPGGVLGVVEHRAKGEVAADDKSGYVGEAQVIALAEAAGFKLEAKSEVNANPKDTKDYKNGVWTLPPSNDHDPEDDAKYKAIGESDRMTLRFVKPKA